MNLDRGRAGQGREWPGRRGAHPRNILPQQLALPLKVRAITGAADRYRARRGGGGAAGAGTAGGAQRECGGPGRGDGHGLACLSGRTASCCGRLRRAVFGCAMLRAGDEWDCGRSMMMVVVVKGLARRNVT